MPEFLQLLAPRQALERLLNALGSPQPRSEVIAVEASLGRICAEDIRAPEPLPAFDRSTVDGYAVRAADTFGASENLPAYLTWVGECPMGQSPAVEIKPGQTATIYTGGMLPPGADAVVMLENTQLARPGEIEVLRAAAVGENLLRAGEDVAAGQVVLPAGRRLRPAEIGGLLALGILSVSVNAVPRVAILSTGDEVVPPEQAPLPGQVRDVNSSSLAALVRQHGGEPVSYGILPDRRESLQAALERALEECDSVVITAGSSASTRDLTADVIDQFGPPGVLVHGVNVRPGKPTILGIGRGRPVIGLPGNPVSALVIAGLFVVPVIRHLSGETGGVLHPAVWGRLAVNVSSQAGREDFMPVRLIEDNRAYLVEPIFYQSNLIFSLARADGLLRIPADANGIAAGEIVEVWLL